MAKTATKKMALLTTTIERIWLSQIVARTKKIEYREAKPYWTDRLKKVSAPFLLRLINGMQPKAPEVTVVIKKVLKRDGEYQLHIGSIASVKNWDKKRSRPTHPFKRKAA